MSFVPAPNPRGQAFTASVLSHDTADMALREAEIARRVRREVAKLRAEAEAEGRAGALDQALQAVRHERSAALDSAAAALAAAVAALAAPLADQEQALAGLVTDLAFQLARHIAGTAGQARPDDAAARAKAGLQTLVETLIREAAAEGGPKHTTLVKLHPADHAVLAPLITIPQGAMIADAAISRGGALVELSVAGGDPLDKIEWDATIEARLEAVQAALDPGSRRQGHDEQY